MVDEKKLLEIFKQKHFQGDSYYCRANNKGDKYIVGYKNDYPMQHGDGVEWIMPAEVAEMIAGQVEPEVKPACETLQKRFDIYAKAINQIDDFFEYHYQRLEREEIKIAVMTYIDNITKQLSKSV